MNEEKKISKKSYYSKLYDVCKYLIEHKEELNKKYQEEFKAYFEKNTKENTEEDSKKISIYSFVSKDENNEQSIYYETKGEILSDLHNGLKTQYSFLIGKGKIKCDNLNPKGSEIMPIIDENSLDDKTMAEMLVITYQFINRDNKSKQMNRKVYDIDLEKQVPMMDYLIKQLFPTKISELIQWLREPLKQKGIFDTSKNYFKVLEMNYNMKRTYAIINFQNQEVIKKWYEHYFLQWNYYKKQLIDKNDSIYNDNCPKWRHLEIYYNTYLYIDLSCNAILQYVIQGIIKNKKNTNKLSSIQKLNKVVLELSKEFTSSQREDFQSKVELNRSSKKNLLKIYSFYCIRDRFLQDTKILKIISNEYDKNEEPIKTLSLQGQKYTWEELQNLFENGSKCGQSTFKHNVANCFLLIKKLNEMNLESEMPCNLIRLRALYRGIYLTKPVHITKRKKSMTIVNAFIENDDIEESDYYFIKEIINMELFREHGLLKEFYAKNEFQENLYYLVCLCLSKLRPIQILAQFYKVLSAIESEISKLCDEFGEYDEIQMEPKENIDSNLLAENYEVTNKDYKKIYQCLESLFNISGS